MMRAESISLGRTGGIPEQRLPAEGPALQDSRLSLSNRMFERAVSSVGRQLAELGINAGDVVAAILPNRVEMVVVMFAAWRLRAAFTPVNPALTADEASYQIGDSRSKLVVVDERTADHLVDSGVRSLRVEELELDGAPMEVSEPYPADVALLIYTSGTTGRPKGVVLDHSNIAVMTSAIQSGLDISADDRALLVLPLFHVNAIMISVIAPLAAGASVVILERFDRKQFWKECATARATYFSAVPTIVVLLNQLDPEHSEVVPALRFVLCGAAPLPPDAIAAFEKRYEAPLIEGYGLTESSVGATLNPLYGLRKPGTVGVALPGVEVRILGDDGECAPPGEVGEVALRGGNVMRGYLGRTEETQQALREGWLRTGDLGRLDEEGYLTLVGREKDMLIRGGENIYPKEIEDALCAHLDVDEAAVVGRADPVLGEVPVAFVSLSNGAVVTGDDLVTYLRQRLAPYKIPGEVHFLPELPKNALGKLSKPTLLAQLQGRSGC